MLALLDLIGGASILAVAVLGWRRSRPTALLAGAAGVAWFAASFIPELTLLHRPLLAQALLTFPGGRVRGLIPAAVLGTAWLGVVMPQDLLPWSWTLTGLLCVAEGIRRRIGPGGGVPPRRWASGDALLGFAVALMLPFAERAAWPEAAYTAAPMATYTAAITVTCVLLLRGIRGLGWQEADAVVEVSRDQTLGRALAELTALASATPNSARNDKLRVAVALLEDNVRLQAELVVAVEDARASRSRIIDTAVEERRRLEVVLAGGVGRYLSELESCLRSMSCGDEEARRLRAVCLDEVSQISDDVTSVARGLHPRVLVDHGLTAALVDLSRRSPVPVEVRAPRCRYSDRAETTLWYACAESLANVWKHAEATKALIRVEEADGALIALIHDDGNGGAHLAPEGGLTGLADRLASVGGQLRLTSSPAGTDVTVTVPLSEDRR